MATLTNVESMFGSTGGLATFTYEQTYGNWYRSLLTRTEFDDPIEISRNGATFSCLYQNVYIYNHWWGRELYYRECYAQVKLIFTDGSVTEFALTGSNYTYNYSRDLSAFKGKKVKAIEVYANYVLYNHCYGYWQYWLLGYLQIGSIQITNIVDKVQNQSNQISFKVGSNYLSLLDTYETTRLINATGDIKVSNSAFSNLSNKMCEIPTSDHSFFYEYTMAETPAETNNAKLFLRYRDEKSNQILGGLSIEVTYYGGVKYTVLEKQALYTSQDLLFTLPDGKFIEKVTIVATETKYLEKCSIGLFQIYNNVPSAANAEFKQYPSLQGTAADTDRTHYTLLDVKPIDVKTNGYLMMNENGIYLLSGSNVIRKSKVQPTETSDPRLTIGDIWLDYSQEPLIAYQYTQDGWIQCHDVPIGFVTLYWTTPTTTVTRSNTALTVNCNTSKFAQQAVYSGSYVFTYSDSKWTYQDKETQLSLWGITVTGTAAESNTVTVDFVASTSSIQSIDTYKINQNGYNVNAFTDYAGAVRGKDGRDGVAGRDGINGRDGVKGERGDPGIGVPEGGNVGQLLVKTTNDNYGTAWTSVVPTGGIKGQFLAKKTNSNFDTEWSTVASTALFNGGRAGQALVKKSDNDLDFDWTSALPAGGTTGQALVKTSNTDYETNWETLKSVPAGGNTNQALVKLSNNDFDYGWGDVAGGGGDTDFIDLKMNLFFDGQTKGYQILKTEDFKTIVSIDETLLDGAAVVSSYWNESKRTIYNSSSATISYRLKAFENVVRGFYLQALKKGEVNFSYSIDGGETWQPIEEATAYSVTTTGFILKIDQAIGSSLNGIGILFK